jgi:hypothetical protein
LTTALRARRNRRQRGITDEELDELVARMEAEEADA